jgi:hypothetical protein
MPPLAAVPDLERELDALYAAPPEEFTRRRNDLARRLKRAHQAEAAAQVQALRKPGVVAAAVNRLAREEPETLERLLRTAEELRRAQVAALEGDTAAVELREATEAERDAVRPLVSAARSLLGERGTPALLERVSQTLRAAAIDDGARPLLRRGRLSEELRSSGFAPLAGVQRVPPRRDEVRRARQERLRELRAEARRLAEEADAAERAAAEAQGEADRLRAEARERRDAAERAADEVSAAGNA